MAEELALEKLPRNRGAIDSDQRAILAGAALVEFVRDQFFARSRLTENKHRSLRGRDQIDLAHYVFECRTLADQIAKGLGLHHRLLQVRILQLQLRLKMLDFLKGARVGDGGS